MLRVAVTGANGFVGGALCAILLTQPNMQLIQLTRKPANNNELALNINTTSDADLAAALKNYDCLIHLAARAHTKKATIADFQRDNLELSKRLANISARANITQFIYVSSIKALGNTTKATAPFSHSSTPVPEDAYGKSKLASEILIKEILAESATALTIVRPPLVWGQNCKGNLRTLINIIEKGIPLPFAGIKNSRDIISLENLCDFLTHIILHPNALNASFLISDEKKRNTSDIIQLLENYTTQKAKLIKMPHFLFNVLRFHPSINAMISSICDNLEIDISHTKKMLNWTPKN